MRNECSMRRTAILEIVNTIQGFALAPLAYSIQSLSPSHCCTRREFQVRGSAGRSSTYRKSVDLSVGIGIIFLIHIFISTYV